MDPGQFASLVLSTVIFGFAAFSVWTIRRDVDRNSETIARHDAVLDRQQEDLDRLLRSRPDLTVRPGSERRESHGRHYRVLQPPNE